MNKETLRRKEKELSNRDGRRIVHWTEKKEDNFHQILNYSVTPQLNLLSFLGMLAAPVLSFSSELSSYLRYQKITKDFDFFLKNVSHSMFIGWSFFAIFVIILSIVQLKEGFANPYFEKYRYKRNGKANDFNKQYQSRIITALSGIVLFFLLFLLFN